MRNLVILLDASPALTGEMRSWSLHGGRHTSVFLDDGPMREELMPSPRPRKPESATDGVPWTALSGERIFVELMTSDRQLKVSRKGSK